MTQLEAILRRRGPVYVDPFLGAGAVWLHLVSLDLVPLVSWMGGKRRMAPRFMELLDLHPGTGVPAILGDLSWWGWVWPLLLDPETGSLVAAWLRLWQGEDPRALWFRLRDAGPPADPVERAAGLLWLQARAASGVPVWWEGDPGGWWDCEAGSEFLAAAPGDGRPHQAACDRDGRPATLVSMDGHGRGPYRAWQATGLPRLVQECGWKSETCTTRRAGRAKQSNAQDPDRTREDRRLVQWGATKIDDAGQRQATEPRLLAGPRNSTEAQNGRPAGQCGAAQVPRLLASDGRGVPRLAGCRAETSGEERKTGGMINPTTIADRIEAVRLVMAGRPGAPPKLADMGRNAGHREKHGWRAFEPSDVASRLDAVRFPSPAAAIFHVDAEELVREWAPVLGARARTYLDGPYHQATGYPESCSREKYLRIADESARHRGRSVVSEGVSLAPDLGRGWRAICLRRGKKEEWVTVYNCPEMAEHGRLFAGGAR